MRIDELQKKSMIDTLKDVVQEYDPKMDRFTLNTVGQALWQDGWTIIKRDEAFKYKGEKMKTFEYFISYFFEKENGQTGFGSNIILFDFNIDEKPYDHDILVDKIANPYNDIVKATPLFYHLRRVIEE